jgi:hypothetical protein
MTEPGEETPQETAGVAQLQQPEYPTRKRPGLGIIAGVSGLTVLVVLFVLLFTAFPHRSTVSSVLPPTPTVPIVLQRYTDPDGHFTISIPKGWTVERQSLTLEVSNPQSGDITFHNMQVTFGGPPWGQNTITVQIFVEPIESDQARQWMCSGRPPTPNNTTLAGLPAWHDAILGGWLVDSSGAHFQIGYAYPNYTGDENITSNSPTATPMPPGFYEQGQQDFQTLLASFMPTPDTPLQCP